MLRRFAVSITCLLLAHAAAGVRAAELGEAKVSSHIGQQLVADIELVAIEDGSAPVQVRLASADVYRGANLDMPAVLGSLNMNVMRRDGRQFLHITSLKAVDTDRLHLFLELADGGRRTVRQATLWFSPDPSPPAPVVAASEPAPVDRWPAAAAPLPVPRRAVAAAPAACPRPSSSAAACTALDAKNAMLRDEVNRLEGKVKLLQAAMGAPAAAEKPAAEKPAVEEKPAVAEQPAPPPEAPAAKPAAVPKAAPAPAKPAAAKKEEAPSGLPWGWIGGLGAVVFVLVGAVVALRARRKAKVEKKVEEPEPEAVEPVLD